MSIIIASTGASISGYDVPTANIGGSHPVTGTVRGFDGQPLAGVNIIT